MKTVNFTNIYIENFGKHSEAVGGKTVTSKLGHRTVISGSNATGKSTIKRTIQYILGTKDENGKEISGIRPHDENGVDIDGLTTVVALTVSVDGLENTLQRTCFQEKNRQGEYTGKDNLQYFVDDVKKGTKKAYDEFVSSFIPNMVCISAQELLMKDTAGRRAMLEVFSKHDTDSIINENPDFEPLRAKLKANTIADLKKTCRDKIKVKTKERDAYPARIDEIEKQKVDIDLAELESHRNSLNEQIKENKAKQEDISKEFKEQQKASDGILELKFELNDLQRKANEENSKKRNDIENFIFVDETSKISIERKIKELEETVSFGLKVIDRDDSLDKCRKEYVEAYNRKFDENSLICQYCGQEYSEDKKEQLRAEFDTHRAEELKRIIDKGNMLKERRENAKREHKKNEEELKNVKLELKGIEKLISDRKKQLSELPESIDISDRPEVQEIQRQIAEKEQAMNKGNSAKEIRQKLREEYEELQQQLNEIQKQFDKAEESNRIDERIEELRQKQRNLSQEIADIEKELDLLKLFERKKAELLESDVNSWFDYVQVKMSEIQQNGEPKDVCLITVDGESYDRNLNHGSKMLAEIDICRAFQRKYGVVLPIILDDTESLNPWDIPNIENQIIMLRWGENEELKIEMEG